nr:hypothetical protein GCM10017745_46440 [Saccharothrix mutabilis subsp. capreolus]
MTDHSPDTAHVKALHHAPTQLTDPGRLIAAIPHLIGFHPTTALVLITLDHGDIVLTTCYDLNAEPTGTRGLVTTISNAARNLDAPAFFACIVDDDPDQTNTRGRRLLHRQLTRTFDTQNQDIDVFGVSSFTTGARWFDYSLPDYLNGTLPDPATSPVADPGRVVHTDYEVLAATLQPDDADTISRRSHLIDSILNTATDPWPADRGEIRRMLAHVRRHIAQAGHRTEPLTDRRSPNWPSPCPTRRSATSPCPPR